MDTAMRDLDQIQERDEDSPSRKVAMLVMAALSTVGLVFAMGVLLRDGSVESASEEDPLARLDAFDLAEGELAVPAKAEDEAPPTLTFHSVLTDKANPELRAAVAAAHAELAELDARDPHPARTVALALAETPLPEIERDEEAELPPRQPKRKAAVVADDEASESGRAGYALQVASYKSPTEARTFADELERRAHPVFIERAVVEGRGEFHRVRVGPFASRGEATRHRVRFEETERIHTLLVRLDR